MTEAITEETTQSATETLMELRRADFAWPDEPSLLHGLSLTIAAGERIVLLGANGCGKSTVLKLLNGLIEPTRGEVFWRGNPITRAQLQRGGKARAFRRSCVLLFQHPEAMLFNPTVREELAYGPRQLGLDAIDQRVARWSSQLNLEALLDKAPFTLSGGQKQKVALASLLTLDPELLLLDEPSTSLDPLTVGWLTDLLRHSGKTIVVATHNLSLAAEIGDRSIILGEDGHILFDGPVQRALTDSLLLERARLARRPLARWDMAVSAPTAAGAR